MKRPWRGKINNLSTLNSVSIPGTPAIDSLLTHTKKAQALLPGLFLNYLAP
jgi:hypothetical protein